MGGSQLGLQEEKETKKEIKVHSNKPEQAEKLFRNEYLCAPSVLSTFSQELGLDQDMALKIATGFGAGVAGRSKICGAITGAIMAIGLKYGRGMNEPKEVQERTFRIVNEFIDKFIAKHGTIECKELIGYDLTNPREQVMALDSGVYETICPKLVKYTAELLEILLNKGNH